MERCDLPHIAFIDPQAGDAIFAIDLPAISSSTSDKDRFKNYGGVAVDRDLLRLNIESREFLLRPNAQELIAIRNGPVRTDAVDARGRVRRNEGRVSFQHGVAVPVFDILDLPL